MTDELQSIMGNTASNIATAASQVNPMVTFGIVVAVVFLGFLAFGIYRLIINDKIKIGRREKNSKDDKNKDDNKENNSNDSTNNTNNSDSLNILKKIINDSIKSGYERCTLRQELFDEQVKVMNNNLGIIRTTIASKFMQECGGDSNIQYFIEKIFDDRISMRLKQTFKKDNLATKTEEQVIDNNRDIIDDAFNNIKNDLMMKGISDKKYFDILDSNKEALNGKIKIILKEARRLAREKKDELDELHRSFVSEQKIMVAGFMNSNIADGDFDDLASTLYLPPNDIIGEMN